MNRTVFNARTGQFMRDDRRRLRKRQPGAELPYTLAQLREMVAAALAEGRCAYCGAAIDERSFSLDHSKPLSRGGGHELENLVCCCASCQTGKDALTGMEWSRLLGFLRGQIPLAEGNVLQRLKAGAGRFKRFGR